VRDIEIAGVGMTAFGKHEDRTLESLGAEAVRAALADAGIDGDRLDAAYVGNVLGGGQAGSRVLVLEGITGIPILNVEAACATGSAALREAMHAIQLGVADVVLVLGVEKLTGLFQGGIDLGRTDRESALGLTVPATYALTASRHMAQHGTTAEQLAAVTVKNRRHGSRNPRAMFIDTPGIDDVLGSPAIADPLTLLQCCPNADGAAAAVLTATGAVKRRSRRAVRVLASELVSGTSSRRQVDITRGDVSRRAAARAYAAAHIGPEDIDVAEVHDPFSIGEVVSTEALGLCPRGQGGDFAASGASALGGRLPVNPSGGLLSKGHPLGATGVAQVAELTWQLRGEAGGRQVHAPRYGLAHTVGGGVAALDAVASVVTILAGEA
jgi:acetyl-CoA acetyltransferase